MTAGLHQGLGSALPLAAGLLLAVGLLLHSPTPLAGNQLYEPLAADVRIALRSAIAERVMEGQATPNAQWLPPGVFSYNPDVRGAPADLDHGLGFEV